MRNLKEGFTYEEAKSGLKFGDSFMVKSMKRANQLIELGFAEIYKDKPDKIKEKSKPMFKNKSKPMFKNKKIE